METIRTEALRDVIKLCPDNMLDDATCETIDDCQSAYNSFSHERGIVVRCDDWKIIFHGYGFVELSKGDHAPATYGANDPAYRGRENVLSMMMAHYERKNQLHDAAMKYKALRNEIWDAAAVLRDNDAIDDTELHRIRANYGYRWVWNQAKAELGM